MIMVLKINKKISDDSTIFKFQIMSPCTEAFFVIKMQKLEIVASLKSHRVSGCVNLNFKKICALQY